MDNFINILVRGDHSRFEEITSRWSEFNTIVQKIYAKKTVFILLPKTAAEDLLIYYSCFIDQIVIIIISHVLIIVINYFLIFKCEKELFKS